MKVSIYRVYPVRFDNDPVNPEEHLFSVIATESSAAYAVPPENDLNQERIEMIIQMFKDSDINIPTTPEGWVNLALDNMNYVTAISVDASKYENIKDAIFDESNAAEVAANIRKEQHKLNKEAMDSLGISSLGSLMDDIEEGI